MKSLFRSAALVLAIAAIFIGQAFAQAKARTDLLTNTRIIAMVKAKVNEGVILTLIKKFPDKLDSSPAALVALRSAGASNKVLLAVRRSTLARQEEAAAAQEEAAPGTVDAGQAAETGSDEAAPEPVQKDTAAAQARRGFFEHGRLSLGFGYPFFAVREDFPGYAGELRYIGRSGIQAFAVRGSRELLKAAPLKIYAGLEAGYVRFGSGRYSGAGAELAPFLGGAYTLDKDFSLSADISPALLFLPGGGTHLGVGDIGWVINLGIYIRIPAPAPKVEAEPDSADTAAAVQREADEELSSWRPVDGESKIPYQDYLTAAEEFASRKNYTAAGRAYGKAMAAVPAQDSRRVFLYERLGWLAMKEGDLVKARDLYLAAVSAAKQAGIYGTNAVNAYCGLAYCFEKLDNAGLAIKYYERALELSGSESTRRGIEKTLKLLDPGRN